MKTILTIIAAVLLSGCAAFNSQVHFTWTHEGNTDATVDLPKLTP